MITYYGSQISPNKVETQEGFLICRNVPIARTGEQTYYAYELQLDGDPNRQVTVHRYENDVFDRATMASFEGKPVTDTHPSVLVDSGNYAKLQKGHVQNVRREGDFIVADLYVNDADLIEQIQSGKQREVSCGYMCVYEPDGDGYKQTKIRGNHVAVVQMGRAGHEVAINDTAAQTAEKGLTIMSRFKEVLSAFGMAAQDAEPKDIEALAQLTSLALDAQEAEPAEDPEKEKAQEAEPAEEKKDEEPEKAEDEMVEKAPKGDDLGTKLDKLIEMVAALAKKTVKDEEPKSDVVEDEDEEEVTEDACGDMTDDAMGLMQAINGISDKKERKAVAKAFMTAVAGDSMGDLFKATEKAAKKAADESGRTTYEKACLESESAYAARNPHTVKKGE